MLSDEENDDRDQIAPAQTQSPSASSPSGKNTRKKVRKASGITEGVSREGHRVTTSKAGPVPAVSRSTSKDRSPSKESSKSPRQNSKKSPRGGAGGGQPQPPEHETFASSAQTLQMVESNHFFEDAPGLCVDDSNSGGLSSGLASMNTSIQEPLHSENHNDSDTFTVLKPHQDIDAAPPWRGLGSSDSRDRLGSNDSSSSRPRSDDGSAALDSQAVDEDGINITDV
jgi:hypothetical protein